MKLKLKVEGGDDETLYRVTSLKIGSHTLQTPIKAMNLNKVTAGLKLNPAAGGLNEIWKSLEVSALKDLMTNRDALERWSATIRSSKAKGDARGDVNVVVLEIDSTKMKPKELEFLSDLAYGFTDIVVVPVVKELHKLVEGPASPALAEYLAFVKSFLEHVDALNNKPVMGTLPRLAWAQCQQVTQVYRKLGVDAYCLDFAGATPSTVDVLTLRPLLKSLKEDGLKDETLLYALNAGTGKSSKSLPPGVAPAKDVLAYGFGFDVLGQKHIALKGPKEMFEKMKKEEPGVRLFDKEAYAYRRVPVNKIGGALPKDAIIPAMAFKDPSAVKQLEAIVNMEQHGIEAARLRSVIKEDEIPTYLDGKSALDKGDLKKMHSARKELTTKQASFGEWF